MTTHSQPQHTNPRGRHEHHIAVGRYRDRAGEHIVALTRDPDAGGPWQLTDTTRVTVFLPEETATEALATAQLYLRERDGRR